MVLKYQRIREVLILQGRGARSQGDIRTSRDSDFINRSGSQKSDWIEVSRGVVVKTRFGQESK